MRIGGLLGPLLIGVVTASSAAAGVIGPAKTSTLANANAFFHPCTTVGSLAFDGATTADGQNVDFVIPAKKAFVATSVSVKVHGLTAGTIADVTIDIEANGSTSNPLIEVFTAPANAAGEAAQSFTLPTGVAFLPPAGGKICAAVSSGVVDSASMYGYFAPAK